MKKTILFLLCCCSLGAQVGALRGREGFLTPGANSPAGPTLFFAPRAAATPDCSIFFSFTVSGHSQPTNSAGGFDNRQTGCTTWAVSYSISGFSSITIALQGAANNNGVPGSWLTFPNQTIGTGSNPNTLTTGAAFLWLNGYNPWVRVNLTSATGSGVVTGSAFGYR